MTSRRNFLTLVGAGAAATLLGCAPDPRRDPTRPAAPDRLLVDTVGGLVVLRGGVADAVGPAVATADGQTIFAVRSAGADTELRILSARTGEVTRSVHLPGRWTPSTGGAFGDVVALVAPGSIADAAYPPAGRAGTSVLIVVGERVHRLDLPGNYTPDAFAQDATGLFVLDWQPSTSPEHYRVREVEISSGAVSALNGRDKQPIPPEAEEQMRGVRRNAVLGTDNSVLYTLYTHQPAPGSSSTGQAGWTDDAAFVHTLHLEQRWAYCVDLPAPFGLDPNASHAIAADSDGSAVYVVDAAAGKVAVVGTESLRVQQVLDIPKGDGSAYATFAAGTLYVATGTRVVAIAGPSARPLPSLPGDALGLVSSVDGRRVYVGLPDAVVWYDAASFAELGRVAVPGLTGLRQAI